VDLWIDFIDHSLICGLAGLICGSWQTISTVGYGDIVAETDLEKCWAVASMLFGALVFAAITGSLASRMMATKGNSCTHHVAACTIWRFQLIYVVISKF
jgi:hypothetical protein